MNHTRPPNLTDYLLLLLLSAIFGASFMLIAVGLTSMAVTSIVAARLSLAALAFIGATLLLKQAFPAGRDVWLLMAGTAILGNVLPFFLIAWGQESVSAGQAGILMALMPLMTVITAHVFTADEKINRYKMIGVAFGFIGLLFLFRTDMTGIGGANMVGQVAILLAAASYAFNVIIMKKLAKQPRYSMIAGVLLISTAIILPFALYIDRPWESEISWPAIVAMLILGLISTAGGNFLRFEIVNRQGAMFLSQLNYLVPIFAVFWAWIILSEEIEFETAIALGFVLAGIAIARIRPRETIINREGRSA